MKLFTVDNREMMEITKVAASGPKILVSGSIMGAIPIRLELTGAEMRKVFPLLSTKVVLAVLRMLFSRSKG